MSISARKAPNFFFLMRHCFIECGNNGAAIYDLYNEELYEIDLELGHIILQCENNNVSLVDLMEGYDIPMRELVIQRLKELTELGLGDFYEKRTIIGKIKPIREKRKLETAQKDPMQLIRLWLEVESHCNLNCVHCDIDADKISRCGCSRLSEFTNHKDQLTFSEWQAIIDNAELNSCQETVVSGYKSNKFIWLELWYCGIL